MVQPGCSTLGGGGWEVVPPPAGFERNSMFLAELQNFIEVVKGVAEPVCTLEDGIRVQEMVEQILACITISQMICLEK